MHSATWAGFQDELEKIAMSIDEHRDYVKDVTPAGSRKNAPASVKEMRSNLASRLKEQRGGKPISNRPQGPAPIQLTPSMEQPKAPSGPPTRVERAAPTRAPTAQAPTGVVPAQAPHVTGAVPAPKAPATVPHAPTSVPHPTMHAPSGGGLRAGAMTAMGAVRQHAAPLAIGSAVGLGLGAMAMRKRQSNAPPR